MKVTIDTDPDRTWTRLGCAGGCGEQATFWASEGCRGGHLRWTCSECLARQFMVLGTTEVAQA